ncbi:hypothetical protein CP8484711_1642A, partial [Chlamydia psittaci 84-8471/1]
MNERRASISKETLPG